MKDIITNQALGTALGVSIAGVIALGLFLIANRFFGIFNYASLSPAQVDKVAQKYLSRDVITKADGPNYSRGIISFGGTLYYFKHMFGEFKGSCRIRIGKLRIIFSYIEKQELYLEKIVFGHKY